MVAMLASLHELTRLALGQTSVFISATSAMAAEARAVRQSLPTEVYKVFWYQDEPGVDAPDARTVCSRAIGGCDVFIAIVSPEPGSHTDRNNPASPLVIHWEYCEALRRPDGGPAIHTYWNPARPESADEHHKEFCSLVVDFDGPWAKPFSSPEDLALLARERLQKWLDAKRRGVKLFDLRKWARAAVAVTMASTALVDVVTLVLWAQDPTLSYILAGVGLLSMAVIAASTVLLFALRQDTD